MKKVIFSLLLLLLSAPCVSWGASNCSPDYVGKVLDQVPLYGRDICYKGRIAASKSWWKVNRAYDELEWYCAGYESCKAKLKHNYNRCNTAYTDKDYAWPKSYDLPSIENWCKPGYIPYGPFYDPYMMKFYWKCNTNNRYDQGENCYFNGYKGAWKEADIAECGEGANSVTSLVNSPVFTDLCKKGTPSVLKKGDKEVSWTCIGKHRSVSCSRRVFNTGIYAEEDDGQVEDNDVECGLINPILTEVNYSQVSKLYTKSYTYFNNPPRKELLCREGTYGGDMNIYTITNKETGNGNYYAWTCRGNDGSVKYCKVTSVCSIDPSYNANIFTYANLGLWEVNPYKTRTSSDNNNTWREIEGAMKTYCWGASSKKGEYAAKCGPVNQKYVKDFDGQMMCEMGKPINIYRQTKDDKEVYSWQCEGEKNGKPTKDDGTILFAHCDAYHKSSSYDGVCGKANYIEIDPNNIDESILCYQGKPVKQDKGANLYRWTCEGVNGGKSMDCRAEYIPDISIFNKVDGVCGEATSFDDPLSKYCSSGAAIFITGHDNDVKWICKGLYGGKNAECPSVDKKVDGQCGDANGKYLDSSPSNGLCKAGTPSVVSGSGPWNWKCEGVDGGLGVDCIAYKKVDPCSWSCGSWGQCIGGKQTRVCVLQPVGCFTTSNTPEMSRSCNLSGLSCGDSNGKTFDVAPRSGLCSNGTSLGVVDGTKWWYWICKDSDSDDAVLCSAKKESLVNGECGSSNGKKLSSTPVDGLCSKGTPSQVFGSGPWVWLCNPSGGGALKVCYALKESISVSGQCGPANGGSYQTAPTTGLCNSGSASSVSSSDSAWKWTCIGLNGGATLSCYANKKVSSIDGQCGPANGGLYQVAPKTGLCSSGSASSVTLTDSVWKWTCIGLNGGATVKCSTFNTINIMAYIQSGISGVTEKSYRAFIDDINKVYSDNGIKANFAVGNIIWYGKDSNCGSSFEGNDLIMCVGPGKGGFMGPPYYTVGANTDNPYGFGDMGVMAEAHELAHYLGFQDLYWLKTTPTSSPVPASIEKDIMTYPYDINNSFGANIRYVLQMNADRVKNEGKESIIYPKDRTASKFYVNVGLPNQSCSIYTRERDYTLFKSKISLTPINKTTNADGSFEIEILAGDPADNNFDIYQIVCGDKTYWMSSLVQEDCYRQKGANQVCNVRCQNNNGWCVSY